MQTLRITECVFTSIFELENRLRELRQNSDLLRITATQTLTAEQPHYYSQEGMVEDRVWRGFERQLTEVATLPGVQEWWQVRSSWFSDEFQAYITSVMAAGPTMQPAEPAAAR